MVVGSPYKPPPTLVSPHANECNVAKKDINIRDVDEKSARRFNAMKVLHGMDNQREMLEAMVRFVEMNEEQFEREVVLTDRDRKNRTGRR